MCVGLGPVVSRARVLVHEVLDRGAQAAIRGGARIAPQVLDRGAEADARGGAQGLDRGARPLPPAPLVVHRRAVSIHRGAQVVARGGACCAYLIAAPGRCPRRRSLCIAGT
jgi:hypothetical protein